MVGCLASAMDAKSDVSRFSYNRKAFEDVMTYYKGTEKVDSMILSSGGQSMTGSVSLSWRLSNVISGTVLVFNSL